MIYGREQFGGIGEPAAVGPALLRLLPPATGLIRDRRADYVTSATISGTSPFSEPPPTQEGYLYDTNPLTINAWWKSLSNTTTQGFAAIAGGIRPMQCSAISADIIQLYSRQFPVPRFFISDSPSLDGSEVSLKVYSALEANYGTQQRSDVDIQYFCKTAASFPFQVGWLNDYLEVPASPSIARTSFTNLYSAGFAETPGVGQHVTHIGGTTNQSLWVNGIEQRGFAEVYELQATLIVELENPSFIATIPLPGSAVALNGNGTSFAQRGAFYVVGDGTVSSNSLRLPRVACHLYCSPYTGRGYLHVVTPQIFTFSGFQEFTTGVTFTFNHNLQDRPSVTAGDTEVAERYFAGVGLTERSEVPSVLNLYPQSLNDDAIQMSVFTSPRVLESTSPPVLPSATGMVDAEQAMFLTWLGGPGNTLYLDGYAQQTPLAEQLALEPFGNQWEDNESGNGNTKRPNYVEDFQGATYFTGESRHNTLPSNSDWSAIQLTIGQPEQQFWPVTENNGTFRGRISTTALDSGFGLDVSKMQPDAFALLQCLQGTHQLTGYRGNGKYIGNNRYTSGNTKPNTVLDFDNTDESYGKPIIGNLFVPLNAGYQPPSPDPFNYWNASEFSAYLASQHVIVGAPTSAISVSTLPRLSEGVPSGSTYTQEQTFLGFLRLASLYTGLGLSGMPKADFAYDYDGTNDQFRYYLIPDAFPFNTNPYVGFLGAIGSRSKLTVSDFCAYVQVLNEENPSQFAEAIGRPLVTLQLRVGAQVMVDSVFASANVYEMVYDGSSYVPGNIVRTLDHDGLTSSTTNFTGFESFIEFTREESDAFISGQPVTVELAPQVNSLQQTTGFARSQSGPLFPVTFTPVVLP